MHQNKQKKKFRKGLLIPAIIIGALFLLMMCAPVTYEDGGIASVTLFLGIPAAVLWFLAIKLRIPEANHIPPINFTNLSSSGVPQNTAPAAQAPTYQPPAYRQDAPDMAYTPADAPRPAALDEIDPERFRTDLGYRDKMTRKVQKQAEAAYNKRIKEAEKQVNALTVQRQNELDRVTQARWVQVGPVGINQTEGLVLINHNTYPFTAVKGAAINCVQGARYVTTQDGRSHSNGSGRMGGVAVGGHIGHHPVMVGGGRSHTTRNTKSHTVTHSGAIPTCDHLGIEVDLNGFVCEVLILTGSVDQNTSKFRKGMDIANTLIGLFQKMSQATMPENVLPVEQEPTVVECDRQLYYAQQELAAARSAVPSYQLPE